MSHQYYKMNKGFKENIFEKETCLEIKWCAVWG